MSSFSSNSGWRLASMLTMGLAVAGGNAMAGGLDDYFTLPKIGKPSYPTKRSGSHKQNARKSRKKHK